MTHIPITLATAGFLGLIYVGLSMNVVRYRAATKTMLGDGAGKAGCEALNLAIRAHGNFQEYVPLALILLGGIEAAGASRWLVVFLAVLLVASRVLHPLGLTKPSPNVARAVGMLGVMGVLIVASVMAIFLAF